MPVRLAARAGVTVVLDPAPAPATPLDAALLKDVTYLTPNESEAERLIGMRVRDEAMARAAAQELLDMGARNVIITLGGKGALVAGRGQTSMVPSYRVEARDSTNTSASKASWRVGVGARPRNPSSAGCARLTVACGAAYIDEVSPRYLTLDCPMKKAAKAPRNRKQTRGYSISRRYGQHRRPARSNT